MSEDDENSSLGSYLSCLLDLPPATDSSPVPAPASRARRSVAQPASAVFDPKQKGVHFSFTAFNAPTAKSLVGSLAQEKDVAYAIVGDEVCPTSGRPHLQGYLQTPSSIRGSAVLKLLPPGAHLEIAMGSDYDNFVYCSKEGTFFEVGTRRQISPARTAARTQVTTDYRDLISLAREGNMDEIENRYPRDFLLRYQTLRTIAKDYQRPPAQSAEVRGVWIAGASGVGKSRLARAIYRPFYAKMANKWFDGYQGEPYIILDDVGPDQAKTLTYHLKIWCDRYPFVAEIKNGSRMISPVGFIITSQYQIDQLWQDQETREALHRRCYPILLGVEPYDYRQPETW